MPPPRALPADTEPSFTAEPASDAPSPEALADLVRIFLEQHAEASVLEDGKVLFEVAASQWALRTEGERCTLQMWNRERNLVRTVVGVEARAGTLRLLTQRFGHRQTKLLHLLAEKQRRSPAKRDPARQAYLRLLERVLGRTCPEWKTEGFRAAMDLERSFGPAYVRGSMVRGRDAWAVIGVGAAESQAVIDGVLTLGILWLHHCRSHGDTARLYKGLWVIVPAGGAATLTLARLPWMSTAAGQWELFELDESTEELTERDPTDQGNLRTRLVQVPDAAAARERFGAAVAEVMALVPPGEERRVDQRLRSSTELQFLLHGFEFARARLVPLAGSFGHAMEITAGHGATQTALSSDSRSLICANLAELFQRRDPHATERLRTLRQGPASRTIGRFSGRPAHARIGAQVHVPGEEQSRLEQRARALDAQRDPLYRAAPERWLESVLREDLAPLTRSVAPLPQGPRNYGYAPGDANDPDPDTIGNRAERSERPWRPSNAAVATAEGERSKLIPRFDPRFVYAQVPAVAGAGDKGVLDLLGITNDGRLAVVELKVADDLQFALQGLDYWIRVRHHHTLQDPARPGLSDLQRHGYFRGVPVSSAQPRLFLVAPALHIHPVTETVLRYISPRVEWTLLALDERWRQKVHVVWRRSGGSPSAS